MNTATALMLLDAPRQSMREDIELWVGGDACSVQRRRCHLTGRRCFSGRTGPKSRFPAELVPAVRGMLDSGAFSDAPEDRLSADAALERQLRWEANAARFWGAPYQSEALVSYDLLIDEKWADGARKKERWSVKDADHAVRVTVDAAAYLVSQRQRLAPRRLVLAAQGVDAVQYEECVRGVLEHAAGNDVLGLGGWCILGWFRTWIPEFWRTCARVLPLIRDAGVVQVHIFGVLYQPVLGPLLYLCDRHGLRLSTDSSAPILATCFPDQSRSGALAPLWEDNVRAWQQRLGTLRDSEHYRRPVFPDPRLFEG